MYSTPEIVHELIDGQGFVLLPEVISPEQAHEARALILSLADIERQTQQLLTVEKRERVYGLVFKGAAFEQMAQHPRLLPILETILGNDLVLGDLSAHILQQSAGSMGIHVDYPYWAMTPPYPAHPVMVIQTIWMLEDFTEENGATLFAPGTQKFCNPPDTSQFSTLAKTVIGKAGSVVLSHGLCWHDTSTNVTSTPRVCVLGNYNPKFIRPIQDLTRDVEQTVIDHASPKLKKLLGLEFQADLAKNVHRLRTEGWYSKS